MEAQNFASRRPAASGLPAFSLPPPEIPYSVNFTRSGDSNTLPNSTPTYKAVTASYDHDEKGFVKYESSASPGLRLAALNSQTKHTLSDSKRPSTTSDASSQRMELPGGINDYTQVSGQWPTPGGNSSYTFSSSSGQVGQNSYNTGRSMYSPSMQYPGRSSQSPATGGELPPPPHGQDLPPFSTPLGGSGSNYGGMPSHHSSQHLQNPILAGQSSSQPPTPVTTGPDSFRAPPTPSYPYSASSTPQQSNFPAFSQPSPTQPSPTTSAGGSRGLSSMAAPQQGSGMAPPLGYGSARPPSQSSYPYHSLPHVPGPVMSNIGNPGGQMALVPGVGGMSMPAGYGPHSGHHLPHMYGQQANQQDRPFKCDICPQSFNRNHDLKRHKRIHLAVKPFPCTFCDKSFSRKDALKVSDIF